MYKLDPAAKSVRSPVVYLWLCLNHLSSIHQKFKAQARNTLAGAYSHICADKMDCFIHQKIIISFTIYYSLLYKKLCHYVHYFCINYFLKVWVTVKHLPTVRPWKLNSPNPPMILRVERWQRFWLLRLPILMTAFGSVTSGLEVIWIKQNPF